MSEIIDFTKAKKCIVDTISAAEIWFQNVLVYAKKKPPTLTLKATQSGNNIKFTCQFNDYENRHRYFEEVPYSSSIKGHGIAIRKSQSLILNTNIFQSLTGLTRVNASGYSDVGTFSYSMPSSKYGTKSTKLWAVAWYCYIDPETGTKETVKSNLLAGVSYNGLS